MAKTAVILAAGRGSRLDPGAANAQETEFSKPLMRLAGRSLLDRTITSCRRAGARRIVVVTGFRAELVEAEAQLLSKGDVETIYNRDWQKANGLSLLACKHVIDDDFALMMSDHIFETSILADMLSLTPVPGSVTLAVDRKIDQVFDLDDATKVVVEDGHIVRISKQLGDYNAIDCGLFLCTPAIFDALEDAAAESGDCSLSQGMERVGQVNKFFPFDVGSRRWQDVDTPEMLAQAVTLLEDIDPVVKRIAKRAG
ncbi:MAG: NTP transferase domain-containing protein [Deltaproteobacteria bacterium]|nr:NTP transferase domain-containing protein [Deltaproteobacteria bacterium]